MSGSRTDPGDVGIPATNSSGDSGAAGDGSGRGSSSMECNICLDDAQQPVVTQCGHLFCWPCLYRWIEAAEQNPDMAGPVCPVCKAGVTRDNVIPMYARGRDKDPRHDDIPTRPAGHRPTVQPTHAFQHQPEFPFMGAGHQRRTQWGNVRFSAGFGAFPGLFMGGINFGNGQREQRPMTPEQEREAFLSRLFLIVGILCLFAILTM